MPSGKVRAQLGFNMHLNWLKYGAAGEFLLPLREFGVSVLEFKLEVASPRWPETSSLINECVGLGFQLSFHIPYEGPYNPAGFSGERRVELERLHRPVIKYAARFSGGAPIILVVHGAKGNRPREELRRDTTSFLRWILDEAPELHPSIELLPKEGVNKIGDNKAELVELVSSLDLPNVGICWDLGHDARNGSKPPPPGFTPLVSHVHVHDISPEGKDHCPLLFGKVPYEEYFRQLAEVDYQGTIVLEVNGYYVSRLAAEEGVHPHRILFDSLSKLMRLLIQ